MVSVFGKPHRNEPIGKNKDYPDDDHKTDVCWLVKDERGNLAQAWNYKNGPAYCGEEVPKIEDIKGFSLWSNSPELLAAIQRALAA